MRWVEIREMVQISFWCGLGFTAGAGMIIAASALVSHALRAVLG